MMQTKHNMVKQAIKSRILDGTFVPNQKINSESELMKQFNVSRHTVRLAIGDLVNQGWLYREQGSGTFCADRSDEKANHSMKLKNIAIISTYISDYIFPSIIRGAECFLSEKGYQVSLFSTNNNHEKERHILEKIIEQRFDGVIIEPTKSAFSNPNLNCFLNMEHLNIPYVMINAYYEELDPVSVVVDDEKGGFLQTEHLIKLGHKDIVGMFKTDDMQGVKRMKGFLKAYRSNQLPIIPTYIQAFSTEDQDDKPIKFLEKLLSSKRENMPTGIVCYNDQLAIRILDALRERNLSIPEDISIVGFDDSFLAKISEVKFTTISHPKTDLGKKAGELIVNLVENKNNRKKNTEAQTSYMFDVDLVMRSSTAEIKKVVAP